MFDESDYNRWKAFSKKAWDSVGYYTTILLVITAGFFVMLSFWRATPKMNRDHIFDSMGVLDRRTEVEQIGQHGDAYGSINALFSGVAMVAAIGAILLQTFEFRHQRMELSLTNETNQERLAFDKSVHEYNVKQDRRERLELLAELMEEFHSDEILAARDGFVILERARRRYSIHDLLVNSIDPDQFLIPTWYWDNAIRDRDRKKFHLAAQNGRKLIDFYHRLMVMKIDSSELCHFAAVIRSQSKVLKEYVSAGEFAFPCLTPPWVFTIKTILSRVDSLYHNCDVYKTTLEQTGEITD